ncbi:glycosyltransferase [Streptomyces koyangensis]|uniref:glycosyltransferase n=1 Tax=Streptomyces koyangensis TaxID=188770 RepID=UPI003648C3B5|nr:glycosyltransferase [Streptomyces albidoflavus]
MSTGSVSSSRAPHPATTGLRPSASAGHGAPPLPGRVCLMIGQLGLGGAEKQLVLLARELSARGVTTDLLVMFEKGPREAELLGTDVTVVELGFRGRRPFLPCLAANLRAFARLVAHLRRTRPEVLTAFLFHAYLAAAPAARLARVPALVAGRRSLGHFKRGRRAALLAERLATRWTHAVVPNAEAVAEDVRRGEGVPEHKITVIPNGLAPEAFTPARPAAVETALPVVLCVANLSRHKGHRHLLDAVARLRGGPAECTLLLVGDGPERAALQEQAAALGIDARFLGRRADTAPLRARADAVVLPSLEEGMPNAVMEAMAAGRPVVATAVGGTPELLEGRGLLVAPGRADALADALARVLTDPPLAARLGRDARDWARAHLDSATMADRYLTLYHHLLER